jgi:hypothetical protein
MSSTRLSKRNLQETQSALSSAARDNPLEVALYSGQAQPTVSLQRFDSSRSPLRKNQSGTGMDTAEGTQIVGGHQEGGCEQRSQKVAEH